VARDRQGQERLPVGVPFATGGAMGKEQLLALLQVLQQQMNEGADVIIGSWNIRFDKEMNAFMFEKCEFGDYCEERPSIIGLDGTVIDKGGPLLQVR
jgi:hypothetical protein